MAVSLPYTRFTHAADHTAPAAVPSSDGTSQFAFTWNCISGYATTVNSANLAQTAPFLTSNATALYPYVNKGTVDVSGGHFTGRRRLQQVHDQQRPAHPRAHFRGGQRPRPEDRRQLRHPGERRRHPRRPPGGQVGGRLPRQDAGRRRRLLLPGLSAQPRVRVECPPRERRFPGRLAEEHVGHGRGRRGPRRGGLIPDDGQVLPAGGSQVPAGGPAGLAVPHERDRQERQGRRLPKADLLRRRLDP